MKKMSKSKKLFLIGLPLVGVLSAACVLPTISMQTQRSSESSLAIQTTGNHLASLPNEDQVWQEQEKKIRDEKIEELQDYKYASDQEERLQKEYKHLKKWSWLKGKKRLEELRKDLGDLEEYKKARLGEYLILEREEQKSQIYDKVKRIEEKRAQIIKEINEAYKGKRLLEKAERGKRIEEYATLQVELEKLLESYITLQVGELLVLQKKLLVEGLPIKEVEKEVKQQPEAPQQQKLQKEREKLLQKLSSSNLTNLKEKQRLQKERIEKQEDIIALLIGWIRRQEQEKELLEDTILLEAEAKLLANKQKAREAAAEAKHKAERESLEKKLEGETKRLAEVHRTEKESLAKEHRVIKEHVVKLQKTIEAKHKAEREGLAKEHKAKRESLAKEHKVDERRLAEEYEIAKKREGKADKRRAPEEYKAVEEAKKRLAEEYELAKKRLAKAHRVEKENLAEEYELAKKRLANQQKAERESLAKEHKAYEERLAKQQQEAVERLAKQQKAREAVAEARHKAERESLEKKLEGETKRLAEVHRTEKDNLAKCLIKENRKKIVAPLPVVTRMVPELDTAALIVATDSSNRSTTKAEGAEVKHNKTEREGLAKQRATIADLIKKFNVEIKKLIDVVRSRSSTTEQKTTLKAEIKRIQPILSVIGLNIDLDPFVNEITNPLLFLDGVEQLLNSIDLDKVITEISSIYDKNKEFDRILGIGDLAPEIYGNIRDIDSLKRGLKKVLQATTIGNTDVRDHVNKQEELNSSSKTMINAFVGGKKIYELIDVITFEKPKVGAVNLKNRSFIHNYVLNDKRLKTKALHAKDMLDLISIGWGPLKKSLSSFDLVDPEYIIAPHA